MSDHGGEPTANSKSPVQLSLPHGINKKLKCETKYKKMVQSRYREAVQEVKKSMVHGKDLLKR